MLLDGKVVQVNSMDNHYFGAMVGCRNSNGMVKNISKFEPIRLTADVLVKCGFEYVESEYNYMELRTGAICYEVSVDWERVLVSVESRTIAEVTTLHDLQNIYFAQHKTELKYNHE